MPPPRSLGRHARLRAPVVVIVSAALGCAESGTGTTASSEPTTAGSKPDSKPDSKQGSTPGTDATRPPRPPLGEPTLEHASGLLNYRTTEGKTIYATGNGKCFVHDAFPPGAMPPPGMEPPRVTIRCPTPMLDPSWNACPGGEVAAVAPDACECHQNGNPPPPPDPIVCPTVHADAEPNPEPSPEPAP